MAQETLSETLDSGDRSGGPVPDSNSSPPPSPSSSSDPSLSRNSSFSRLNAEAPAFVPTPRPQPLARPDAASQTARVTAPAPPPPPPGMLRVFHVPVQHPMGNQHQFHSAGHHVPVQYHHHQHHQSHNQHQHHHNQKQHHQNHGHGQAEHDHGAPSKNGLSDEVIQKIINQVEYYFSDLNLATTDHLMRFISKDPEGYVPISTVASFKKIKALISSNSQLASVLRNSSKLVVSEDGKKVRRLHLLTESDMEELQSRVVVAENLPEDHCHQNLMKVFSAVGRVKAIRTCQPQASNGGGASASRSGKGDSMVYSNKLHAFVEYESIELAEKAANELNEEDANWRKSGLRVRLLLKRGSKPGKKGHDGEEHAEEDDLPASEQQLNERQLDDSIEQPDGHLHGQTGEENANERDGGQRKGRGRGRGRSRGRGQYHYHNNNRGGSSTNAEYHYHNHRGGPSTSSASALGMSEVPAVAKQQPPGPRMPDGTRGFAMGRGKPVAVTTV